MLTVTLLPSHSLFSFDSPHQKETCELTGKQVCVRLLRFDHTLMDVECRNIEASYLCSVSNNLTIARQIRVCSWSGAILFPGGKIWQSFP